jgi:hypothetical protein
MHTSSLCTASLFILLGISTAQAVDPTQAGAEPTNSVASSSQTPNPAAPENNAFVNGALSVPGADADSQTVPAKFSERNDRMDHIPTMALPLPLTEEQRRRIAETVLRSNPHVETINANASDILPDSISPHALPPDIAAQIPEIGDLSYVRVPKKVLLVRAPNMIVVDEIATD